jgi:hypothetical protein
MGKRVRPLPGRRRASARRCFPAAGAGLHQGIRAGLEGLAIYSKGKLVKESGVETYYFLISSKRAL